MEQGHLKLGDKYVNKDCDNIYVPQEVTDTHCIFVHSPIFGDCVKEKCEFKDANKWKRTKKDVTQLCGASLAAQKLPGNHAGIADDWQKNQITYFVAFAVHPIGLVSTKRLKKKDLQLYPIGNVVKMRDQSKLDTSKGLYVKWKGQAWALQPYKTFATFDKPEEAGILCTFMFVKTNEDAEAVNMSLVEVNYKGLTIPILENTAAVKEHCWLYRGDQSEADGPAKKKAKKKWETAIKYFDVSAVQVSVLQADFNAVLFCDAVFLNVNFNCSNLHKAKLTTMFVASMLPVISLLGFTCH